MNVTGEPEGMGIGASKPAARGLVISFDALGTLYRFREPVAQQYLSVAQRCGLKSNITTERLDGSFRAAFRSMNADHPNYGKGTLASPADWWEALVKRSFGEVVKDEKLPDDLGKSLYEHFSSGNAYELYPDVRPFLQRMHEIRKSLDQKDAEDPVLMLGIVTNSDDRVKRVLESMGLAVGLSKQLRSPSTAAMFRDAKDQEREHPGRLHTFFRDVWSERHDFDFLATSYEADAEKPDSAIFNYAANLARFNTVSRIEQANSEGFDMGNATQTMGAFKAIVNHRNDITSLPWIHVGDEYTKDYLGAKESGIDAFHLVRDGEGQKPVQGAQNISNLIELLPIVNVMVQENLMSSEK